MKDSSIKQQKQRRRRKKNKMSVGTRKFLPEELKGASSRSRSLQLKMKNRLFCVTLLFFVTFCCLCHGKAV